MPKIVIKNLEVGYENAKGDIAIGLNDFSCELEDGSFNVIVGYSGCGKTTLLRTIAGFLEYDGEIYFDDVEISNLTTQERNVALVSQEYVLYPHLTIFDNIASPLLIAKAPREEIIQRVHEIAEYLGISHCLTRKPRHLSGGQQQKVALARAIIKRPQVFLFDEPLSNFDEQGKQEARQIIKDTVKKYGITTIYVTHDFAGALRMADNLIVMNHGKVEISGNPEDVYNSHGEVVSQFKQSTDNE